MQILNLINSDDYLIQIKIVEIKKLNQVETITDIKLKYFNPVL